MIYTDIVTLLSFQIQLEWFLKVLVNWVLYLFIYLFIYLFKREENKGKEKW